MKDHLVKEKWLFSDATVSPFSSLNKGYTKHIKNCAKINPGSHVNTSRKKSVIKLLGYSFFSPDTEKDVWDNFLTLPWEIILKLEFLAAS